jgi:hypothetical protein
MREGKVADQFYQLKGNVFRRAGETRRFRNTPLPKSGGFHPNPINLRVCTVGVALAANVLIHSAFAAKAAPTISIMFSSFA